MLVIPSLLCIAICLVFIIDETDIINSIKKILANFLTYINSKSIYNRKSSTIHRIQKENIDLRPFECSLCMVFWIGNLYLLYTSAFNIQTFTLVCILSWLTRTIKDLFDLMQSLFDYFINNTYKKLK
jgi:hypothetical protein